MALLSLTKATAIYLEIKNNIINGLIKPGTHLVIRQVAAQYGVSEIPVREALRELTADGLVETIPHVGSRVSKISFKSVDDMLVMRECLEPFAAELAAKNASEKDIDRLEEYNFEMKKAFEENDIEKYRDLNRAFHKLFIESSGNVIMAKTILDLMESEKRMRMIFQLFPDIVELSNKEHGLIVNHIRKRNAKALAKVVYEHKKRVFDKMRVYLKKHLVEEI